MKQFPAFILLCGVVAFCAALMSPLGAAKGAEEGSANPPLSSEPAGPRPPGRSHLAMETRDASMEIRLRNGAVVLGTIVGETASQITVSSWQEGSSRQVVVNKADITEVVDHVAERQLIMDRATKARIERDLATARDQVTQSEKDIEKASKALDTLSRQRQASPDAARANPDLDRQQARLRAEIKGSKVAATFTQARVAALQNELNRVNQRILELERKSWKAR